MSRKEERATSLEAVGIGVGLLSVSMWIVVAIFLHKQGSEWPLAPRQGMTLREAAAKEEAARELDTSEGQRPIIQPVPAATEESSDYEVPPALDGGVIFDAPDAGTDEPSPSPPVNTTSTEHDILLMRILLDLDAEDEIPTMEDMVGK